MVSTVQTTGETALQAKLKKKSGFTLAELLIVVAIIAILAAIAIPLYSAQMERARASVDQSTLSAATSMATSDYLLRGYTGDITYTVFTTKPADADNSMGKRNISVYPTSGGPGFVAPTTEGTKYEAEAKDTYATDPFVLIITTGGEIKTSKLVDK